MNRYAILPWIWVGVGLLLCGCRPPSANQAAIKPEISPRTEAPVTARDIEHMEQQIVSRIATHITNAQETNYALDAERAKLEAKRLRANEKGQLTTKGVLVSLIIFGLIAPSALPTRWHAAGYMVAFAVLGAALMIPFIWPF